MSLLSRMIEPKQMIRDEQKLFTDSMLKAMIIPLVTEQLLQMVVGLADTMMVSYAGEAVVAGVGLDTMIYTIFIYLFTAISAGGKQIDKDRIDHGIRLPRSQPAVPSSSLSILAAKTAKTAIFPLPRSSI